MLDLKPGQRVMLDYTDDPYTALTTGDTGTITRIDNSLGCVEVARDNGSHLSMWPAAGDRIRPITPPVHPADHQLRAWPERAGRAR